MSGEVRVGKPVPVLCGPHNSGKYGTGIPVRIRQLSVYLIVMDAVGGVSIGSAERRTPGAVMHSLCT